MNNACCVACNKKNAITKCEGCSQSFCFNDFGNHRQELNKKLDEIESNHDLIRQSLVERTKEPKKHPLIQQIDQWELESTNKIKQIADENRESVFRFTMSHHKQLETKLNELTSQLKKSRQENDFIEAHLDHWSKELTQIQEELIKPSDIKTNCDSTPFLAKIYTEIPCLHSTIATRQLPNINTDARWMQNGIMAVQGSGSNGINGLREGSWGMCIDDDQTVYFADYNNHRIMEWKNGATSGRIVAGGNGQGNRHDQLNCPANVIIDNDSDCLIICDRGNQRVVRWPRQNGTSGETIISDVDCVDVAMDKDGYIYVCDLRKGEVRRWKTGETNGILVTSGNLGRIFFICVDDDCSVYVSEYDNSRVSKWMKGAKEGIVDASYQDMSNALLKTSNPSGIAVDQFGTIYVAEYSSNRVTRWLKDATQGTVVVSVNQPWDLSFDRENNLYVAACDSYQVQKFNIEQNSCL